MPWKDGFRRAPERDWKSDPIPASSNPYEQNTVPFLDRPRLSEEEKSEVAVLRASSYAQAETAVRDAIELLGGVDRICKKGQTVLIKPNNVFGLDPNLHDTTHPSVIIALVKILKETGAIVKIGESAAWGFDADECFEVNQIKRAAIEAGADELINFYKDELIPVDVPDPRSFPTVKLPRSVVECDVFCDISKFKNNLVVGNGMTLGCKSMVGMMVELENRYQVHRTPVDMAMGCADYLKTIIHKYKLSLIDAIYGMEGIVHAGPIIHPGLIIASHDPVAAEGVAHHIAGYHCLESPMVQVAMKAGLGTGDLSEIRVLGNRLEDVRYPVQRWTPRFVQKYPNVHEYLGAGICNGCLWPAMTVPPVVDPDKKYAVISGTRALIAKPLEEYDEVWLVGKCACYPSHQFKGFSQKIKAAKEVVKLDSCPGCDALYEGDWGGSYDTPFVPIGLDMCVSTSMPACTRSSLYSETIERRTGLPKMTSGKSVNGKSANGKSTNGKSANGKNTLASKPGEA